MKKIAKTIILTGIALSLFGCGDDDKKVDSGAIADSICKSMVQCEGKLGKLPGTLTAADVQNKIDTCNNLIVAKFFNNAKSDSEAADYMKCLEGLECNALDSVYTSQGDTVPQACQSQHQAYTNSKNGNGGSGGNGNTITCDPNNEVCACFDDSCNPKWITDNSCICQGGGSSNPPTGQCADDDIACWCKKSPNLPACQGSGNPPADQCSDDDLACQCKKNPNLPACQETPPPADQCSDDDFACQCKKNPNLPACQETPPPADQCSDDDLECQCKKNPNLPACKSGNDEIITCTSEICKCFEDSCNPEWVTDNACKCKGSGGGGNGGNQGNQCDGNVGGKYVSEFALACLCTANNDADGRCKDPDVQAWKLIPKYCAPRIGEKVQCGTWFMDLTEAECMLRFNVLSDGKNCFGYNGNPKAPATVCAEKMYAYLECITKIDCGVLNQEEEKANECIKDSGYKDYEGCSSKYKTCGSLEYAYYDACNKCQPNNE